MLPDHRGPCPRCLQSSFEELICPCNRTVIEPPVPCGTRINCAYPCAQPLPPCGHPRTPHTCHAAEEGSSCPPCPHLTNRTCDCGKSLLRNVRCSQERVSCGSACGKLLDCGYHACDRTCHTGECGSCVQVCGKPRKGWYVIVIRVVPVLASSTYYCILVVVTLAPPHATHLQLALPPIPSLAPSSLLCLAHAGGLCSLRRAVPLAFSNARTHVS
jgi:hypothetical protein